MTLLAVTKIQSWSQILAYPPFSFPYPIFLYLCPHNLYTHIYKHIHTCEKKSEESFIEFLWYARILLYSLQVLTHAILKMCLWGRQVFLSPFWRWEKRSREQSCKTMQSVSELRLEPWVPSSSSGSPTSIFNYCTLSSLEILKSQARSFGDKRLIFHFEFLTAQALMLLSLFQFSCLLLSEMSTPHLCPFRSFFSFIPSSRLQRLASCMLNHFLLFLSPQTTFTLLLWHWGVAMWL